MPWPRIVVVETPDSADRYWSRAARETLDAFADWTTISGSDALAFLEVLSAAPEGAPCAGAERDRRAAAFAGARLGDRLRLLRRATGLTGKQLGARTGMSQSRISDIETGRRPPSAAEAERLAAALGAGAELRAALAAEASSLVTDPRQRVHFC